MRLGANDLPGQLAEDAVAALDVGGSPTSVVGATSVDLATSLRPFVAVFDPAGTILATDGSIAGEPPIPPNGVLQSAHDNGRNVVTWAPAPGVRIATVVLPWSGGTVVAGRSLRAVEERIDTVTRLAALALLASLTAVAAMCAVGAAIWPEVGSSKAS